jgi:AcrR family transcriptional regulator
MPRRYRMQARATAVEQTRQRIVETAKALHAEQGIIGTSYEDVAREMGVSQATVYRHFPTLDDLIPVCAQSIEVLRPMTPETAAACFPASLAPFQRLEWLIRGTCDCYTRDQGWLYAARGEEKFVPALREVVRIQEESLRTLVRAALEGTPGSERTVQVLTALIDFPFWQSLRSAGLTHVQAADQILELVRDQLAKEHIV